METKGDNTLTDRESSPSSFGEGEDSHLDNNNYNDEKKIGSKYNSSNRSIMKNNKDNTDERVKEMSFPRHRLALLERRQRIKEQRSSSIHSAPGGNSSSFRTLGPRRNITVYERHERFKMNRKSVSARERVSTEFDHVEEEGTQEEKQEEQNLHDSFYTVAPGAVAVYESGHKYLNKGRLSSFVQQQQREQQEQAKQQRQQEQQKKKSADFSYSTDDDKLWNPNSSRHYVCHEGINNNDIEKPSLAEDSAFIHTSNDAASIDHVIIPSEPTISKTRPQRRYLSCIIIGVLTMVIAILVAIIFFQNRNPPTEQQQQQPELPKQSEVPSAAPIVMVNQSLIDLLSEMSFVPQRLQIDDTPENKAMTWMAQDPNFSSYSEERIAQRYAMATLFYSLDGETNWIRRDGWLSYDQHECDWYALRGDIPMCSQQQQQDDNDRFVVAFMQSENGLKGVLPRDLALLSRLQVLEIVFDSVSGFIPTELGLLTLLRHLSLRKNNLIGTIPTQLANLRNLVHLDFGFNGLTGTISSSMISSLTSLTHLDLISNGFDQTIPTEIGMLEKLRVLNLSNLKLNGEVPSGIWGLTSLEQLMLSGNLFSLGGTLPSLERLSNLEVFLFRDGRLQGTLPSTLGKLTTLRNLQLATNFINGPIPTDLGNLVNLQFLHLQWNRFTGEIPSELGQLTNLLELELRENKNLDYDNVPIQVLALQQDENTRVELGSSL